MDTLHVLSHSYFDVFLEYQYPIRVGHGYEKLLGPSMFNWSWSFFLSLISIMNPTRVIANVTLPSASSYGITLRSWIHDQYQKSKQLVDPKN